MKLNTKDIFIIVLIVISVFLYFKSNKPPQVIPPPKVSYIEVKDTVLIPVDSIVYVNREKIETKILTDTVIINRIKEITSKDSINIFNKLLSSYKAYNSKFYYKDTIDIPNKVLMADSASIAFEATTYQNKIFSRKISFITYESPAVSINNPMLFIGGGATYKSLYFDISLINRTNKYMYTLGYDVLNKSPVVGIKVKLF